MIILLESAEPVDKNIAGVSISPSSNILIGHAGSDGAFLEVERSINPLPPVLMLQAVAKEEDRMEEALADLVVDYLCGS